MRRVLHSLLLACMVVALSGSVALSQSGSAGYYEFSTFVRFQKDVRVYGDAQVNGDFRNLGTLSAGFFRATPQTAITVTANSTITPTGTFQPITAAGSVGTASIAPGNPGDLLILYNQANVTITLTDTGTLKLAGNAAMAQYGTLTLVSDGTSWLQVAKGNN